MSHIRFAVMGFGYFAFTCEIIRGGRLRTFVPSNTVLFFGYLVLFFAKIGGKKSPASRETKIHNSTITVIKAQASVLCYCYFIFAISEERSKSALLAGLQWAQCHFQLFHFVACT